MLINIDGDIIQTDNILKLRMEGNKVIISFLHSNNYLIVEAKTKPIQDIHEAIASFWSSSLAFAPKIKL